ncbi:hypothetical protein C8F04DRAFT_518604 [Mycena alexandri]|uniref:Uncharacterized protein n=1 Tax=Mycena alexandri TaxID=1745969 RepID=A0AAD6TE74_9AGAR|nr:hypothetical protein C8F04DRAFT_518604 [Mycena alexandri]
MVCITQLRLLRTEFSIAFSVVRTNSRHTCILHVVAAYRTRDKLNSNYAETFLSSVRFCVQRHLLVPHNIYSATCTPPIVRSIYSKDSTRSDYIHIHPVFSTFHSTRRPSGCLRQCQFPTTRVHFSDKKLMTSGLLTFSRFRRSHQSTVSSLSPFFGNSLFLAFCCCFHLLPICCSITSDVLQQRAAQNPPSNQRNRWEQIYVSRTRRRIK